MASFEQSSIKCLEGKYSGVQVYLTFNPETVTFSKGVKWTKTPKPTSDNPDMDFGGGKSGTFKISDITFDATMPEVLTHAGKQGSAVGGTITTDIEQLVRFTEIDKTASSEPRPPKCQFIWGQYKSYEVYVQHVSVTYELFDSSGKPLRAKVSVEFVEAEDANTLPYQNPTSRSLARKVRTVLEGETLDWIAFQEYGSAAAWRHIAETNNLDDPLAVRAGQVLRLVPLNA
ncbi:MAG: LysM peptidoglycan-binding domain-containing protein [Caldilineaceae bacterium]|nr:LysM peptidoglycan-binding domain-containing protein [Caldilineaceae bacterium]